jgi:4a-hydroxytetrahydrobiopterin dehydratase
MADDQVLSESELADILGSTLSDWEFREGWLRRTYNTPGWPHTMMLVQTIGYLAEAAWHHPDLKVGYAKVTVMLQTHRVRGITRNDIALAKRIDQVVLWLPKKDESLEGFPKKWVH